MTVLPIISNANSPPMRVSADQTLSYVSLSYRLIVAAPPKLSAPNWVTSRLTGLSYDTTVKRISWPADSCDSRAHKILKAYVSPLSRFSVAEAPAAAALAKTLSSVSAVVSAGSVVVRGRIDWLGVAPWCFRSSILCCSTGVGLG